MPKTTKEAKSESKKVIKKDNIEKKTTTAKTKTTKTTTKSKTSASKNTTSKNIVKTKQDTKSNAAKKTTAKKVSTAKKKTAFPEDFSLMEYYDLPNNYNKTVVKVLAQTPNTLFVYWDISSDDRKNYIEQYGDKFFEITKPVLIVYNITNNYSFEVDINDFANCWYLNVNDSKCEYKIELGRRPISNYIKEINTKINSDYIYISSSNEIESPNDHILFDNNQKMVYFKNTKNNTVVAKNITLSYIQNIGKLYNIYDIYSKIYKNENIEDFDFSNPSSKGNPTSTFK